MSAVEDTSSGTTVRVVVVDDHPVFRIGMVALLEALDAVEVVGQAATQEEAVAVVGHACPDVVVMDLDLGAGSGVEATRAIVRAAALGRGPGGHDAG